MIDNINRNATPTVSVIIPAYNEEALLEKNISEIISYVSTLEVEYRWEVLIINDGSTDRTGAIADELAQNYKDVRVLHHPRNFGLGQALKFGFANTRGNYVITLDVDLSYCVEHIGEMLNTIRESHAKIVLASPYMKGGTIKNVPWVRRMLSILGNRFLRVFVRGHFSTLTSLARAYDGPFIRSLDLRATGMDVMPETLHKAMVLRARIVEMPARLDWGPQLEDGESRSSSMRLVRHVFSTVVSGFIFRPFLFFIAPGIVVAIFSLYVNFWMVIHFIDALGESDLLGNEVTWTQAFANSYDRFPHTFIIGFLSAMLAIQLVGLGLMALQSKRYFEELFHLGSTRLRAIRKRKD